MQENISKKLTLGINFSTPSGVYALNSQPFSAVNYSVIYVHCAVCTVQYTLYTVHCTVYILYSGPKC